MIDAVSFSPMTSERTATGSVDYLLLIQMSLVQDYDEQLKDMGEKIKGLREIKKMYREDIQTIRKYLTKAKSMRGNGGPDGKGVQCVELTKAEQKILRQDQTYTLDPVYPSKVIQDKHPKTPNTISNIRLTEDKKNKNFFSVDDIQNKLDTLEDRYTAVNEQTEITSLSLSGLTNQRKSALDTMSQIVGKYHDTVGSIIRGMRG